LGQVQTQTDYSVETKYEVKERKVISPGGKYHPLGEKKVEKRKPGDVPFHNRGRGLVRKNPR